MKQFFLKCLYIFLVTTFYLLLATRSYSQDFRNDYQVEYFLSEKENRLNSKVRFSIAITNFRADVYVKQFSIGFPKSFSIREIKAYDDYTLLSPQISPSDGYTKIALEFSQPKTGKGSVNNLYLEFYQDNLFNLNGNIWEVIIPTVEDRKDNNYKILVHLPQNSQKSISIAKPKPDSINGNTITWNNPSTKTVYAVFGDIQYYQTELAYHLKNPKLVPVYTEVAFPPDTLYQKIYLDEIDPEPVSVSTDSDGNFLGRYFLKPQELKTISFKGTISVFSKRRENFIEHERKKFLDQKKYLLSESKYWKISQAEAINEISANPKEIYSYVTNKLNYDYDKVKTENIRLGADSVLTNPDKAVCMEFTDLFIAIARRKGIYAREIQGYGFSQDPSIRPLSLVSDILHSWPEYFDTELEIWQPVDPTWENTSGIDYFSSFDLNHITFAIHGKDPENPLPAGTYKIEDSRDVSISPTNKIPKELQKLAIQSDSFPKHINSSQTYQFKLTIQNKGNTYFSSNGFPIRSVNLKVDPPSLILPPLAPFEKKTLSFSISAKERKKKTEGDFTINFPQNQSIVAKFKIVPFYYELAVKISYSLLLISGLILIIFTLKKRSVK
ncbi:hypothetical protein A2859_04915 [Candidatus Roizmanbacteria bacterium RIFCSPHIGHO2_01_FULL_37_16b]|nr:MAG: hypothetical protein A2859_04915 [Candidatus Roizmanbacteria bacterium RIFCSPHIGHO2_01_FULL_37_16b]